MKVKYTIKWRTGNKPKKVTGYFRVPRDLPGCFTSDEAIEFLCKKHSLDPAIGLDIRLHNYTSKHMKYDNTIRETTKGAARKAADSLN